MIDMGFFVRDKRFYKNLALIALPVAAQNMVNFAVSMADTVMVGMLGEVQLSAASIANQLGFVYMLLTFGLGSGSGVIIAQFWGKRELEPIHKTVTIMYRVLFCGALLFTSLAVFFPESVMSIFSTDKAVIAEGASYLRVVGLSYFFAGVASASVTVLRSVGQVRVSVAIYITSLLTNICFNYLFIFGKFGFPRLEIVGAAVATCIARTVEILILLVYLIRFEREICYRFRMLFMRKLNFLRDYLRTALPVIFNEILWGSGVAAIAIVIGRMGTEFTAAYSICSVLSQLVMIANYGVGNASAVIIGRTVGEGKYDTVKQYAHTFLALSILLGLVASCLVLFIKGPLLGIYNISETARTYANQIMSLYAVVVVFQAVAMVMLIGVLRAAGDTRFVFLADTAFMWGISIPLAFLTGLKLGWPVWAVYMVIKSDEVTKVAAALIRLGRGNWINDITKLH